MKPITIQITIQVSGETFWDTNKVALENTAGNVGAKDIIHHAAVTAVEKSGLSVVYAQSEETELTPA